MCRSECAEAQIVNATPEGVNQLSILGRVIRRAGTVSRWLRWRVAALGFVALFLIVRARAFSVFLSSPVDGPNGAQYDGPLAIELKVVKVLFWSALPMLAVVALLAAGMVRWYQRAVRSHVAEALANVSAADQLTLLRELHDADCEETRRIVAPILRRLAVCHEVLPVEGHVRHGAELSAANEACTDEVTALRGAIRGVGRGEGRRWVLIARIAAYAGVPALILGMLAPLWCT